jgi:hypothetical protein
LFGGALAVYVHYRALSFWWVGVWIFAPCVLVWAVSAAWSSLMRKVRVIRVDFGGLPVVLVV